MISKYLPPLVIPGFLPGNRPETISSTVGQSVAVQSVVGHSLSAEHSGHSGHDPPLHSKSGHLGHLGHPG